MIFKLLFYLIFLLLFGIFIYVIYYNAAKFWVKEKIDSIKEEKKLKQKIDKFTR